MLDSLIIFAAQYLLAFSFLIAGYYFFAASADHKKKIFLVAAIGLPLIYILALAAGFAYYDPRPFVLGGFAPLIPHAADNGFPSDHALLASAIASIFMYFNRRAAILLWMLAALVVIARVVAGLHHPIDVTASMLIALVGGFIAWRTGLLAWNVIQ